MTVSGGSSAGVLGVIDESCDCFELESSVCVGDEAEKASLCVLMMVIELDCFELTCDEVLTLFKVCLDDEAGFGARTCIEGGAWTEEHWEGGCSATAWAALLAGTFHSHSDIDGDGCSEGEFGMSWGGAKFAHHMSHERERVMFLWLVSL